MIPDDLKEELDKNYMYAVKYEDNFGGTVLIQYSIVYWDTSGDWLDLHINEPILTQDGNKLLDYWVMNEEEI